MKKVFITGSTDGLGFMIAESLINKGHKVVLHARPCFFRNDFYR